MLVESEREEDSDGGRGGCLRGMGRSEFGWCPPNPENPSLITGSVWAELKEEEMRLGDGQQPCLTGVAE